MGYILKLQLRDTRREFATELARDNACDKVMTTLTDLGIPENNIILSKIDTQFSDFTNTELEKVVDVLPQAEENK